MAYSHVQTIQKTDRKFPKTLVGDFTFFHFCDQRRRRRFLQRNIRKFLAYHDARLLCNDSAPQRNHSPVVNTQFVLATGQSSTNHLLRSTDGATAYDELAADPTSVYEKSVLEAASQQTLVIRTMDTNFQNSSRRSIRKQEAPFQDSAAELTLNLVSIRKKLNFSANGIDEEGRPLKKTKREHTRCLCSLTIWENIPSATDALVKKHVNCTLITSDTADYGPNVQVQLDEPFTVKAKDLMVYLDRQDKSNNKAGDKPKAKNDGPPVLGIGAAYFLELKLIPTKSDGDWPPIPILGKSDGDQQRGLSTLAAEKLRGAMLIKYDKLPQAPEQNVPLSVFFLRDGRTHRTKYGLELNAQWSVPKVSERSPEAATKLPGSSWTVDSSGNSFGREKIVVANRARRSLPNSLPRTQNNHAQRRVKVSYLFDPDQAQSQDVAKELRMTESNDLGCPVCTSFTAKDVPELRFHFVVSHSKYNFNLANDHEGRGLRTLAFRIIPVQATKPNLRARRQKHFEYIAKNTPFDAPAFLNGDKSWTSDTAKQRPRAQLTSSFSRPIEDPVSMVRRRDGRLPIEKVPEFRKPERKKHPVVHLDRKCDDKKTPYSSISHRPRSVTEDPMSETDDDIDDEWFIQCHLETLDVVAKEKKWNELKTELIRRWDRHRLEEKFEHPRFMSDSLVRFVRKEIELLRNDDADVQAAFKELLEDLVRSRYITIQFEADIKKMVSTGAEGGNGQYRHVPDAPASGQRSAPAILNPRVLEQTASVSPQAQINAMSIWTKSILSLPRTSCGVCTLPISNAIKETINCSNHTCSVSGSAFHLKCVRQRRRQRDWLCHGCRISSKAEKGKARVVD
jgi:hypothetical protein